MEIYIIFGFLAVISGIIFLTGRSATAKDFFTAEGGLPWYIVGGTMLATMVGGATVVGYVGSFNSGGMIWFWIWVGNLIYGLILLKLSGKLYGLGKATIGEMFEMRFGQPTKIIGSIILTMADFAVVCAMVVTFASTVSAATGVDPLICRIIGVVLFVATATFGGLRGVAITDAIQGALIFSGVLITAMLSLNYAGGFDTFLATVEPDKLSMFNGRIPTLTMAGNFFSLIGLGLASQSTFFQRMRSCKSSKDATKALGLFTVGMLIIFCGIALIGLTSSTYLEAGIPNDSIIIAVLDVATSPAFAIIYTTLITSAVLTTGNSMLLGSSLSFVVGIVEPLSKKTLDADAKLKAGRLYMVTAGILAFAVGTYMPTIIGLIMIAYTVTSIIVVPLYMGLLTKVGGGASGFFSCLVGIVAVVAWELIGRPMAIHPILVAAPLSLLAYFLFAGKKPSEEQMAVVDKMKAPVA